LLNEWFVGVDPTYVRIGGLVLLAELVAIGLSS